MKRRRISEVEGKDFASWFREEYLLSDPPLCIRSLVVAFSPVIALMVDQVQSLRYKDVKAFIISSGRFCNYRHYTKIVSSC